MQCRIFQVNISYKCDIIEDKIILLSKKTSSNQAYFEECDKIINKSIDLLAAVREKSTLDSERLIDSNHNLNAHRRIATIHAATINLLKEVYILVNYRYENEDSKHASIIAKHGMSKALILCKKNTSLLAFKAVKIKNKIFADKGL
ncbi:hypothetical protein [Halomonas sp.]|uniref:hypothetical protein n=1 Tax=unclassified Halomonas TaxID=2609666 RepID=UPI003F9884C2